MIGDCMVQLPHKLDIADVGRDVEEGNMFMVKLAPAYLGVSAWRMMPSLSCQWQRTTSAVSIQ